jgi:hypothetical protein
MGLYPIHLKSVAQLKSEKQTLKKAIEESSLDDLFSTKDNNTTSRTNISGGLLNFVLPLLGSETVLDTIFSLLPSLTKNAFAQRIKKILFSAGKEILSGYAKWEAAELALRGLRLFIRSRKKKHKEQRETK